jgi:cytochrome c556
MKKRLFSRLLLTGVLAGSVFAAHGAVDDDFMRSVEDTFKEADAAIGIKDAKTAKANALELEKMFQEVVQHYASKGDAEDGVKLSRKSIELSVSIEKKVSANDFDGAAMASAELGRTCKSCHNIYKE